MRDGYDVAQICLNGHMVNSTTISSPDFNKPYCPQCGAKTITKCVNCDSQILGHYHVSGVVGFSDRAVHSFCHDCGAPYPWTEARLKAARELADELEGLSRDDKETLKRSLDSLIRDTPETPLAATRFARIVAKAKSAGAVALKEIVKEVITETAKKVIFGL